jgi:hypothetical protein
MNTGGKLLVTLRASQAPPNKSLLQLSAISRRRSRQVREIAGARHSNGKASSTIPTKQPDMARRDRRSASSPRLELIFRTESRLNLLAFVLVVSGPRKASPVVQDGQISPSSGPKGQLWGSARRGSGEPAPAPGAQELVPPLRPKSTRTAAIPRLAASRGFRAPTVASGEPEEWTSRTRTPVLPTSIQTY